MIKHIYIGLLTLTVTTALIFNAYTYFTHDRFTRVSAFLDEDSHVRVKYNCKVVYVQEKCVDSSALNLCDLTSDYVGPCKIGSCYQGIDNVGYSIGRLENTVCTDHYTWYEFQINNNTYYHNKNYTQSNYVYVHDGFDDVDESIDLYVYDLTKTSFKYHEQAFEDGVKPTSLIIVTICVIALVILVVAEMYLLCKKNVNNSFDYNEMEEQV